MENFMTFVISTYGDEYVPFLTVCLSSLRETHPKDKVVVFWNDISQREMSLLLENFHDVEFTKQDINVSSNDFIQRISMKMRLWKEIIHNRKIGEALCFLDSDILVYKNVTELIKGDYDLIYTWKPEKYPINTGVIVVKNSEKIRKFFDLWHDENERIINDPVLLEEALNKTGGGDQQALINLMDTDGYDKDFTRRFDFGDIKFKAVPCDLLNQTNSVPINSGSYIFHYKAGWHPILLKEEGFTENRSVETSYEMYSYWINYYADVNENFIKDFVIESSRKHLKDLDWSKIQYEHRGIPHSEMLAAIAVMKELNVDVVIESGRCRGQSTYVLSQAFENSDVVIESMELLRDENADFAEERLKECNNIVLHYGDANIVAKEIVSKHKGKRIGVIFDGPKGEEAFKIFSELTLETNDIVVGFFHDLNKLHLRKLAPSRIEFLKYFDRTFCTDDGDFVKEFSVLDKKSIVKGKENFNVYTWAEGYKGWDKMGSYGPTLGIVFPTVRDSYRYSKKKNVQFNPTEIININQSKMRKLKGLARSILSRIKRIAQHLLWTEKSEVAIVSPGINGSAPKMINDQSWMPENVPIPIDKIIDIYSRLKKDEGIFFIEIGANDGVSVDPMHSFIVRDSWKGILVEPVPYVFKRLKENYRNNKDLKLENVAIAEKDGEMDFYSLEKTENDNLPDFYDRIGTFDYKVMEYHKHAIPNIEDFIKIIKVPTLTFMSLLKKHNVKKVNVVMIDTEGYDYEIIKLIDFNNISPDIILFENKHLLNQDHKACCELLETKGYKVYGEGGNTIAVNNSVLSELNLS